MRAPILEKAQLKRMAAALNQDAVFVERAKYFVGSVGLEIGSQAWVFRFNRGQIEKIDALASDERPDIVLSAPDEEWCEIFSGKRHLLKALNPYHGRMSVRGDPVTLASNMRPIFYLFSSLQQVNHD